MRSSMKAIMLDAIILFPGIRNGVGASILRHRRVKGCFPYSHEGRLWCNFLKKTHSTNIWWIVGGSSRNHTLHLRQYCGCDDDRLAVDASMDSFKAYGVESSKVLQHSKGRLDETMQHEIDSRCITRLHHLAGERLHLSSRISAHMLNDGFAAGHTYALDGACCQGALAVLGPVGRRCRGRCG